MKKTRWIDFLGGWNLLFTLTIVILIGLVVTVFNDIQFIFEPIVVLFSSVIMPIVIALLLYYLFNPVIDFLEEHKVPRIVGVGVLFLTIIGLISLLVAFAIQPLQRQVSDLIDSFPQFIESISNTLIGWLSILPIENSADEMFQTVEGWIGSVPEMIANFLSSGSSGLSTLVSSLSSIAVTIITFPIVLFFLLKDDERFFNAFLGVVPPRWRKGLIRVSSEINSQVGSYIKGQLIIATSIGVMMFIGFSLINLKYSGVLAIVAGFTSIIPYIGPTLAFIPALVVAVADSWTMVLFLIIVWMIVQFIDGNFIEPNVMGKQLNVHPLTIIIVLLVAGELLGIFGLVFGVPIYAIFKVIVVYLFQQFKSRYNQYYGDVDGEYDIYPIEDAVHKADNKNYENLKEEAKEEKENDSTQSQEDTD
ncbi:AI-2E family transporter [Lacticigenium naphthae]|uniref:AI-2E family transporter n=1 Tax=Lacticigenium naphthae TaxID=515351 RepID=UPI00040E5806|nr:AI-2E family transporter [Lacticigenium naphthae]